MQHKNLPLYFKGYKINFLPTLLFLLLKEKNMQMHKHQKIFYYL